MSIAEDVFDISGENKNLIEWHGMMNLMKGAVECSDLVGTVSPSYAEEIKGPYHGCGLEQIILDNSNKVMGILNGIDTDNYDPEKDPVINANYSSFDLTGKMKCKSALQKAYGFEIKEDIPVVAMISRLAGHKGFENVISAGEDIMKREIQFIVLGTGEEWIERSIKELAYRYPEKAAADIRFCMDTAKMIYAGADIFLMPSTSEPCGLAQMAALRYGTVPVVSNTGGLKDSIVESEIGNGFKFENEGSEQMLKALDRAVEAYKDKEKWEELIIRGMNWKLSWKNSAEKYLEIYERI